MRVIHEDRAWATARSFAQEAANLLGQHLLAVYVTGSLAGGSFRPGRSDIDTLLVVSPDCAASDEDAVDALRKRVCVNCGVPKDFGAVVVRQDRLVPPYDPTEELVPEILRLKRQGILIWGTFDLESVPDPNL